MRRYRVYRYQYREMPGPRWNAQPFADGLDALPPSVLASPGILVIEARNKQEAIAQGRERWKEAQGEVKRKGGKG